MYFLLDISHLTKILQIYCLKRFKKATSKCLPGLRLVHEVALEALSKKSQTHSLLRRAALVSKILVVDPAKRITISEIKADEWFKINNETPSLATHPTNTDPPPSPSFQSIEEEEESDDVDESLP